MKKLLFLTTVLYITTQLAAQTVLLPYRSLWKYLDDGSNQDTAWRMVSFSDATWKKGTAQFGYGDGDEATVVNYGPDINNKFITTYFRKTISIADFPVYSSYKLNIKRDDGAVVYVNGAEAFRTNMPEGPVNYLTKAPVAATDDGDTSIITYLDPRLFSAGNNTIAVEIHQNSKGSPDISFDLQLTGMDTTPPFAVSSKRKLGAPKITNGSSVVFSVNFSERISGLDASDFKITSLTGWVNATVSSIISMSSRGTAYDVTVSNISGSGRLRLDLKGSGTGIRDMAGNSIAGGYTAGENYLVDQAPPEVLSITRLTPAADTTADNTVTFRAVFNEKALGVDVSDFTVTDSGKVRGTLEQDAITPVGTDGTTYDIKVSFVSGSGTLRLDLNSGTGIMDTLKNTMTTGYSGGQSYYINQTSPFPELIRGPYLQVMNETGVTIRWRTDIPADSKIWVGSAFRNYTLTSADTALTTEHEIRIIGLTAGTRYFYRIGSSTDILQAGQDNYFTTAPETGSKEKIRIAVFGDCGMTDTTQGKVLKSYLKYTAEKPAELLLILGDNAYVDGTDSDYTFRFFLPYGNTILKNHALFSTPGNHDYHTSTRSARTAAYYQSFTMPLKGESGGIPSGAKAYYSFDWGNIHFLSLDSYGFEAGNTRLFDTLGPQVTWVKKDLEANTKPWTIVFFHHPPFTKGTHNSDIETELIKIRTNFVRILERYGVDLVLCGHSHNYERSYLLNGYYETEDLFNPEMHTLSKSSGKYDGSDNSCPFNTLSGSNHGTVYVVAGSSSKSGEKVDINFPHNALPFATRDGGMLYLEVEDNRLDAKFLHENGSIFDQFTILKDAGKTSDQFVAPGTPVTLRASWVGAYRWSTGTTTREITVTPESDTTYTVSDTSGCIQDVFHIGTESKTYSSRRPNTGLTAPGLSDAWQVYPTLLRRGSLIHVLSDKQETREVMITDGNGRVIRRQKFYGAIHLDTQNLAAGLYFISISGKGTVLTRRVLITD